MATTPPYGSFQALALRATVCDEAGHPVLGARKGYFTKGVVDILAGVVLEKGDRDTLKRGDGHVCQTSKEDDVVVAGKVELNLCSLDAAMIGFLTGANVFSASNIALGYEVLGPEDTPMVGVILEAWTKAWDNSVQATPSGTTLGDNVAYFHWVWPKFKGAVDDQKLDQKHNAVPIVGESVKNSHTTANGPYDDWPTYVAQQGGVTRPYGVFLDTALPSTEGYLTVTALAS